MGECAFCDNTAKLTAEHITSKWMGELFPGRKQFKHTNRFGEQKEWIASGLDLTAKVVCEPCNVGWMSRIEAKHARPVMSPLMLGKIDAVFGANEARSLALFAFKSAVVIDYAQRHREPFFSRRLRHAFRKSLFIPNIVGMWMVPYLPDRHKSRFDFRISLSKGELTPGYDLQLYICTFGLGALAFQVVAHKQLFFADFRPLPGFEDLAVPFWPTLQPNYVWPGLSCLWSFEQLIEFHKRWLTIAPA
ncbi:MAG: hypothetical protein WAU67_03800 [Terracidiphilus sp.]